MTSSSTINNHYQGKPFRLQRGTFQDVKSVLVLGADSRAGVSLIRQYAKQEGAAPKIHAFCSTKNQMDKLTSGHCHSIHTGDAHNAVELDRAIALSQPDVVIVAVGTDEVKSCSKSQVRTKTTENLVHLLEAKESYSQIRVIIISSAGAGISKIKIGFGVGKLMELRSKNVLQDHTLQEEACVPIFDRVTIVRPTQLTDCGVSGFLEEFGDREKMPTRRCHLDDLAQFVVNETYECEFLSDTINVTTQAPIVQ